MLCLYCGADSETRVCQACCWAALTATDPLQQKRAPAMTRPEPRFVTELLDIVNCEGALKVVVARLGVRRDAETGEMASWIEP